MAASYAAGLEATAAVATVAGVALAAFRARRPPTLAAALLALLVALAAKQTFPDRARSVERLPRAGSGPLHLLPRPGNPGLDPPPSRAIGHGANRALTAAARRRVPSRADYATVTAGPAARGRAHNIWRRYVLAPRVEVALSARPRWVLVFGGTPAAAGIHARRSWRYGDDWLVER